MDMPTNLPDFVLKLDVLSILTVAVGVLVLVHLVPYLADPHGIRSYPGPFVARFSKLWLARLAMEGRTATALRKAHEEYGTLALSQPNARTLLNPLSAILVGPFVRISPDEVSIAHPEALHTIYAHSSGAIKSPMYDAFAVLGGTARSAFNTTPREEHARRRKLLTHAMSAKALADFEPVIYHYERSLLEQWDDMCAAGVKGISGAKGDCTWQARDGRAWFDCLPCEDLHALFTTKVLMPPYMVQLLGL